MPSESDAAYCQARKKLKAPDPRFLFGIHERKVVVVDGTGFGRSKDNQQAYEPSPALVFRSWWPVFACIGLLHWVSIEARCYAGSAA